MEWQGDAICIYFSQMKNDQTGERPRDPRHVYAIPCEPAICPILAIGMYWATYSFDSKTDKLFPGRAQYDRFRKLLRSLLGIEEIHFELDRRGIQMENIGTHSMRKGSATYCSSGSTSCLSSTAVQLRAGWSLGNVQNTYLRYEGAGDMHVGRTAAGLSPNSALFGILPPRFRARDAIVSEGMRIAFGKIPKQLTYIAEFALASLVHHAAFILSN